MLILFQHIVGHYLIFANQIQWRMPCFSRHYISGSYTDRNMAMNSNGLVLMKRHGQRW